MPLSDLMEASVSPMATVTWMTQKQCWNVPALMQPIQEPGQISYAGYLESHHFPCVAENVRLSAIVCCSAH